MLVALTGELGFCLFVIRALCDSSPPVSVPWFGEGLQAHALAPLQPALPIGWFSTWGMSMVYVHRRGITDLYRSVGLWVKS